MGQDSTLQWHRRMVKGLANSLAGAGNAVKTIETHGASVLLAGGHAYKIKKPVNLGFLDYSTLGKRRHYCHEELRLNHRYAPALYLDVVPVTGPLASPELDGAGPVLDYAVRMRRFPSDQQLDQLLARGKLGPADMAELAGRLVDFHRECALLPPDHRLHSAQALAAPLEDNLRECRQFLAPAVVPWDTLRWSEARINELAPLMERRLREGHVRECHGDLHLGNLFRAPDGICPFDGIEFSEALRFIDVLNELAFLAMDLDARDRPDLSALVTSHYLEGTGDYGGLPLLALFQVYRALIRAKVTAIRRRDVQSQDDAKAMDADIRRYTALADRYTQPGEPGLWLMGGLSGSGKSTRALEIVQQHGALRIRSDVERKRLFGLDPGAHTNAQPGSGIYDRDAGRRTYERLCALAEEILGHGYSVVVDAASLRRGERDAFRRLAAAAGRPFHLVWCEADEATLRSRIRERASRGGDPSEATEAVLDRQLETAEFPTPDEYAEA